MAVKSKKVEFVVHHIHQRLIITALLIHLCGCVSLPDGSSTTVGCSLLPQTTEDVGSEPQIVVGNPNRFVDGIGWIVGVPAKLALWDRRADNHSVSPETIAEVTMHLRDHQMNSVMVRVNQYDPLGEWKRLCQNKNIPLGWRMVGGSFTVLKYSLLPGRIFGEDWYNPFTESLHLYSDIPSLGINEAVYARQVRDHKNPGGYATIKVIPIVGMWHETRSTTEALEYIARNGTAEDREEAYRILYPSYGGNWGAGLGSVIPFGSVWTRIAGSLLGHLANGVRSVADVNRL